MLLDGSFFCKRDGFPLCGLTFQYKAHGPNQKPRELFSAVSSPRKRTDFRGLVSSTHLLGRLRGCFWALVLELMTTCIYNHMFTEQQPKLQFEFDPRVLWCEGGLPRNNRRRSPSDGGRCSCRSEASRCLTDRSVWTLSEPSGRRLVTRETIEDRVQVLTHPGDNEVHWMEMSRHRCDAPPSSQEDERVRESYQKVRVRTHFSARPDSLRLQ